MDRRDLERKFRQVYYMAEEISAKSEIISVYLYNGFHEYSLLSFVNDEVKKYFNIKDKEYDFYLRVVFDKNVPSDGYNIKIMSDKKIFLEVSNRRGVIFGLNALYSLVEVRDCIAYLPILKIQDYPSFKTRGIIEGFYGEPWSHKDRLDSIKFLKEHRMNTYMYAPKDDVYHRNLWRKLYEGEQLDKLLELIESCKENNIAFWYCISPGKDFKYTDNEDFKCLYKKLEQVINKGVNKFALLLDDIDYRLKEENENRFYRPGIAHSYISNKVNEFLKNEVIESELIMCPTEYATNFNSEYIDDIKNHLNNDIKVIWTGYNCCAEVISYEESKNIREYFGHELVFWDNYPVNDWQKERIFLGPLVNRGKKLPIYGQSMISNPMNQWHLSKVALITISEYMWNTESYNSEEAYERAILEVAGENLYNAMRVFCYANRYCVAEYYKFKDLEAAISKKEIDYIFVFYNNVENAMEEVVMKSNKNIGKELEPWVKAFRNQMNLLRAYKNNEDITGLAKICSEDKFTLGIPNVLNVLNKFGVTKLKYKNYERKNYWDM